MGSGKKRKIYIIGAGISGLTLAYYLAEEDYQIEIYESSNFLGGRCRSFFDKKLGVNIDNGNHICLRANEELLALMEGLKVGGSFNFFDDGIEVFSKKQACYFLYNKLSSFFTGLNFKEKISLLCFLLFPSGKTVGDYFNGHPSLLENLVEPLCRAILNSPVELASAKVLRRVMLMVAFKGSRGLGYFYPKKSWHDALLQPLSNKVVAGDSGHILKKQSSLISINTLSNKVNGLLFKSNDLNHIDVRDDDIIVLATPANISSKLLGEDFPDVFQPIANIHFKYTPSPELQKKGVLGVVNSSYIEWVFFYSDRCSVTVSAASHLFSEKGDEIAHKCWLELSDILQRGGEDVPSEMPENRVIIEKRATFECSKGNLDKRPSFFTRYSNCFLVGDYVNNGLPSTLEGSVMNARKLAEYLKKSVLTRG